MNGYTDVEDILAGQEGSVVSWVGNHGSTYQSPEGKVFRAITMMNDSSFDVLTATDNTKYINIDAASTGGGGTGGLAVPNDRKFKRYATIYGRWTHVSHDPNGKIILYVGT